MKLTARYFIMKKQKKYGWHSKVSGPKRLATVIMVWVNIYKYYKFDFYMKRKSAYEKALLIREKIGFQNLDVLYKIYYSLAATNRSQHDFEKALSYGTKALELAKKFNPLRTRDEPVE